MDSGWAVVLGAVIALAGSTLLPWWRESRTARRLREEEIALRRDKAVIELLTKNAALAMASAHADRDRILSIYEDRQRAMIRLLFEVETTERKHLSYLIVEATPLGERAADPGPGLIASALQATLLAWSSGELGAESVLERYTAHIDSVRDRTED